MDYRLELLDDDSFEQLAIALCSKLFGIGTIAFAGGKDGGRDGKFTGAAANYPSSKVPWVGKFIIQAKHSLSPVSSCADSEFETKIRNIEIPKIKKLREDGDVDNYLIFTNRKYSGITGEALLKVIQQETGLQNVAIIGKETMNQISLFSHRPRTGRVTLTLNQIVYEKIFTKHYCILSSKCFLCTMDHLGIRHL